LSLLAAAKIFKISTLKLLQDSAIEKLIPDIGPQLEFKDKLSTLKNQQNNYIVNNVQDENVS